LQYYSRLLLWAQNTSKDQFRPAQSNLTPT